MDILESFKNQYANFGDCQLDCDAGRILVKGEEHHLEPLVFQFLLLLIKKDGKTLSKQEIIETLWPSKIPKDEAIRAMVKKTREVLQDNARKPTYIKTIPNKGYVFLPPVEIREKSKTGQKKNAMYLRLLAVAILVVCVGSISLFYLLSLFDEREKEPLSYYDSYGRTHSLETIDLFNIKLEKSYGVSAHYFNNEKIVIYDVRDQGEQIDGLLIQRLDSSKKLLVKFEEPISGDYWWSSAQNMLLVEGGVPNLFYTVELVDINRKPIINRLNLEIGESEQIYGFSNEAFKVYIYSKAQQTLFLLDLISSEKTSVDGFTALFQNDTDELDKLTQLLNLWPSPTQALFAGLVKTSKNENKLLIFQNFPNAEFSIFDVATKIQNGFWDKQGERFSFVDEHGQLFSYQRSENQIFSWETGHFPIKSLLIDCRGNCFVVANPKSTRSIFETKNPFIEPDSKTEVAFIAENTRDETSPIGVSDGYYFLMQTKNNGGGLLESENTLLIFSDNDGNEKTVYDFGLRANVRALRINQTQDKLLGLVNSRPFVFDTKSNNIDYANIPYAPIKHLMFDANDHLLFYAQANNSESGVYKLAYPKNSISLVSEGDLIFYDFELESTDASELGGAISAQLRVSSDGKAAITINENKNIGQRSVALPDINLDCDQCWKIVGHTLYSLQLDESAEFVAIDLLTGQVQKYDLGENNFASEFSLNSDARRLYLTKYINRELQVQQLNDLKIVY